jgi:hypothetical protein
MMSGRYLIQTELGLIEGTLMIVFAKGITISMNEAIRTLFRSPQPRPCGYNLTGLKCHVINLLSQSWLSMAVSRFSHNGSGMGRRNLSTEETGDGLTSEWRRVGLLSPSLQHFASAFPPAE